MYIRIKCNDIDFKIAEEVSMHLHWRIDQWIDHFHVRMERSCVYAVLYFICLPFAYLPTCLLTCAPFLKIMRDISSWYAWNGAFQLENPKCTNFTSKCTKLPISTQICYYLRNWLLKAIKEDMKCIHFNWNVHISSKDPFQVWKFSG